MKQVVKRVYRSLPFKQPIFELLRKYVRPGESIHKHLHFEGVFSVEIDADHSFRIKHHGFELENRIFWGGLIDGWEKTSTSLWCKLVQNADVILDIGANTGIYSLIAKSINPHATVVAFEPIHRVYDKLVQNNRLNGFDIISEEFAASNADGVATVFDTPTEHVYSVTVNQNLNSTDTEVVPTEIKIRRLDNYIDEMKLEKLDLIKIDVETHEAEVLEGLGKYLNEYQPTMLIEILNDDVGKRVEAIVKEYGYLYFNIDELTDKITPADKITRSDYYNFLLCKRSVAQSLGLTG